MLPDDFSPYKANFQWESNFFAEFRRQDAPISGKKKAWLGATPEPPLGGWRSLSKTGKSIQPSILK
jgi:hypothetical protein